mmetsp:Transcript_12447/g.45385  ORF Transcript_12447/g.45385 Transcript_12447/m.45385 type:complete len:262 (-) Transcript_12447:9-794(-)
MQVPRLQVVSLLDLSRRCIRCDAQNFIQTGVLGLALGTSCSSIFAKLSACSLEGLLIDHKIGLFHRLGVWQLHFKRLYILVGKALWDYPRASLLVPDFTGHLSGNSLGCVVYTTDHLSCSRRDARHCQGHSSKDARRKASNRANGAAFLGPNDWCRDQRSNTRTHTIDHIHYAFSQTSDSILGFFGVEDFSELLLSLLQLGLLLLFELLLLRLFLRRLFLLHLFFGLRLCVRHLALGVRSSSYSTASTSSMAPLLGPRRNM